MKTMRSFPGSKVSSPIFLIAVLIYASCALALTSCSTGTPVTRVQLPAATPPSPPPGPQANQRRQCPQLPPARSDRAPDLLANHDHVAALYHECSSRNDSLLQSIDAWEATAWQWYCGAIAQMGLDAAACRTAAPK